jgi:hypothetical protein
MRGWERRVVQQPVAVHSGKRIPQSDPETRKAETHPGFSVNISIFLSLLHVCRYINGADGLGNSLPLCGELVCDRYS